MSGTVTVVIPTYRNGATLARAVTSVLDQTYADLSCLVINDGADPAQTWEPLAHISDPRLVRFDLPTNRGRFYAEAVALAAVDTPWFHPHDSDDWTEPHRIEAMMTAAQATGAQYVVAGMTFHEPDQPPVQRMPPIVKGRKRAHHRQIYMQANYGTLWATEALRSIGGPHPDYRFSYDTMLTSLALNRLRWTVLWDYGYHYCRRPDSLSNAPETGMRTRARQAAWARREREWRALADVPTSGLAGHRVLRPLPETVADVARDAGRLREALGARVVA